MARAKRRAASSVSIRGIAKLRKISIAGGGARCQRSGGAPDEYLPSGDAPGLGQPAAASSARAGRHTSAYRAAPKNTAWLAAVVSRVARAKQAAGLSNNDRPNRAPTEITP